jgi:hypothetical protein
MEISLLELLENPENIEKITTIRTDYQTFKDNEVFIKKKLGNNAEGFFIEKSAYIIFKEKPNILIIINKDSFNRENFYFKNINIEIEGKSNRRINNAYIMLKDDLISYKYQLIMLILIYIIVFCTTKSMIGLENLNETFIDIISIFIGMLFVFATMFYEKDELEEAIKNGKVQEIFLTDKYIFVLAMISMVLVIISNGILKYEISNNIIIEFKQFIIQNYYSIYWIIKYGISEILTGISIIFNYICFKSIIDYYLAKLKSKAINRHIKEIRENIIK